MVLPRYAVDLRESDVLSDKISKFCYFSIAEGLSCRTSEYGSSEAHMTGSSAVSAAPVGVPISVRIFAAQYVHLYSPSHSD